MRRAISSSAVAAFAIATSPLLVGCGYNSAMADENDRLRRELFDAQKQLDASAARIAELEAAVQGLSQPPNAPSAEVLAATPIVQRLEIDRLSHVREPAAGGSPAALTCYIRPIDGRERFLQIAGEIIITIAALPKDRDAVTLARRNFTPAEVLDAYRSGITGTHYTFELPFDPAAAAGETAVTLRVVFIDPSTGVEHAAQREIKLP